MQRNTTKRFYVIHSWLGAVTAILMFVICFTGAASVFGRPELKIWSNEVIQQHTPHAPEVIEELVRQRLVPLAREEILPIIREHGEPTAQEIGRELWDRASLWRDTLWSASWRIRRVSFSTSAGSGSVLAST